MELTEAPHAFLVKIVFDAAFLRQNTYINNARVVSRDLCYPMIRHD